MNRKLPAIVISDLKYPMNLGSIARTMSCSGYKELYLLRPCSEWNSMDAIKFSLFGRSILEAAKIIDSLEDIRSQDSVLLGFSRRIGKRRSNPLYLGELSDFTRRFNLGKQLFFVFGGESSGLSTKDLNLCDYTVSIEPELIDGSLSLPVAAAIVMHEFKKGFVAQNNSKKALDTDGHQASALIDRTKELLKKINFIDNKNQRRLMSKLKDIAKKLSVGEIRLLHTILGRIKEE